MSNNIDLYIQEIEVSKQDIKGAIQSKGVTPTGGLSSYAEAILSIPTGTPMAPLNETITESGVYNYNPIDDGVGGYNSVEINVDIDVPTFETQSKKVTIKKNGTTSIVPDSGYDGLSEVNVTVQVSSGGSDKPQIFNGFAFTGGDIAQVDFSQYDWSLVYDTSEFFRGCTHSTGDWSNFLENFNGEVLSTNKLFYECTALTSVPQLDTSKVMDMRSMFYQCRSLTTIPQLDTSNVTNMSNMFYQCRSLTTIPQLDTSNVTNMSNMFYYCTSLTTIPQLDTSNVTSMSNMFYMCNLLTTIPQLDTSNVTNMNSMLYYCSKLTTIPQLNTSKVKDMSYMFQECSKLTTIPQLDTSNVTNMSCMFQECSKLTTIPQLDTSNVKDMSRMFSNCPSLTELPNFNCAKVTNFGTSSNSTWLYDCSNVEKMGVVDCDSVPNISYFFGNGTRTYLTEFGGCRNLGKASSVSGTNGNYFMNYAPNLSYQSVLNVLNGLYDRASAGLSVLTLKLHANHLAMLSEDDIAIATNKGWTIV